MRTRGCECYDHELVFPPIISQSVAANPDRDVQLRPGGLLAPGAVLVALLAGCVNLTPPWKQVANQDASFLGGSGGEAVAVDADAVGGTGGNGGTSEGGSRTDAAVIAGTDGPGLGDGGDSAQPFDTRSSNPDAPKADADGGPAGADAGANDSRLAETASDGVEVRPDIPSGSGGMDGSFSDSASGGAAGGGGRGGAAGADAGDARTDAIDAASVRDSGGGGAGSGGAGAGGSGGTGGSGTGGSGGNVCTGYQGRDAGGGVDEGQVAYYRCESAGGASGTTLQDSSGHAYDGTLHTGVTGAAGYSFAAGKVHNALTLVAAQQGYVTLPAGLLASACEATIATWVWVKSSQDWQRIFDFGRDSNVYMFLTPKNGATGKLRFAISLGSSAGEQIIDGTQELPTGVWVHVAVVLGPGGGALYVDAQKVGSNSAMTLRPADLGNLPNLYIGRSQWTTDPYFDGSIDSFRIYDRALSDEDINAAYGYDGT